MNPLTEPCARRLLALVREDEPVIAEGSVWESRIGPFQAADSQKVDYILVTPDRILWCHHEWDITLDLEQITAWGKATYEGHRVCLILSHEPLERPTRRMMRLRLGWEELNVTVVPYTRSHLGFSRETDACKAIQRLLEERGVPPTLEAPPAPDPPKDRSLDESWRHAFGPGPVVDL